MSDRPSVVCVMRCVDNVVEAAITIERPLNGFYGCQLRYPLDWTPDLESEPDLARLESEVRERVAWKVGLETALPWDPGEIVLTREQ